MKIAAIVILYHPNETLIANIMSYYDYVDQIYAYDNTDSGSGTPIKAALSNLPKVKLVQDFKNEGIAKRLNAGCIDALEKGFDWILTMDQDSGFTDQTLDYFISCFKTYPNKEKVAMFGTEHGRAGIPSLPSCDAEETDSLITSGMLLNLQLYKAIGPFDEALFIDSVDHDYCIRTQLAGYSIIRFNNIYMAHEIGTEMRRSSIKTLFLIKKKKALHSALRCYYMYRNMLYLEKKFQGKESKLLKLVHKSVMEGVMKSLYYGRDSIKLIKYILKAKRDFKKNKMGKIDRPFGN